MKGAPIDKALCEYLNVPVLDFELFLVMWGNEADALFSVFHMAVEPVPAVTVDEQVFLPLIGIQPDHIRIQLMDLTMRTATLAERLYTTGQSMQIEGQTGCIGHLRADMGADGRS